MCHVALSEHWGYHVPPKDRMVKVYSRDYQAGPLRKLEEVEAKIDAGEFDPDVTRSGRFNKKGTQAIPEYNFLLSLLYRKLHVRGSAGVKSPCGRATAFQPGFETYLEAPESGRSLCKNCFGDATMGSVKCVA